MNTLDSRHSRLRKSVVRCDSALRTSVERDSQIAFVISRSTVVSEAFREHVAAQFGGDLLSVRERGNPWVIGLSFSHFRYLLWRLRNSALFLGNFFARLRADRSSAQSFTYFSPVLFSVRATCVQYTKAFFVCLRHWDACRSSQFFFLFFGPSVSRHAIPAVAEIGEWLPCCAHVSYPSTLRSLPVASRRDNIHDVDYRTESCAHKRTYPVFFMCFRVPQRLCYQNSNASMQSYAFSDITNRTSPRVFQGIDDRSTIKCRIRDSFDTSNFTTEEHELCWN